MDYKYGLGLFNNNFSDGDLVLAYAYLYYDVVPDRITKSICNRICTEAQFISAFNDEVIERTIIARANIKLVNRVTVELLPNFIRSLSYKGYDANITIFNPDCISDAITTHKSDEFHRKIGQIVVDTYGFSSIYCYINPKSNAALEQCIKTKYKNYVSVFGEGLYVQLSPQDTFDMLYSFIDDVFNLI